MGERKEFVGKFMFHPVGHGLFYSGTIKTIRNINDNKQYSFLYDCGGCDPNIINPAIENADLPSTINLLIISHFHADHIRGIFKLKELVDKNKIKIETVVLPYLDKYSKILYIAALANEKREDMAKLAEFIRYPQSVLEKLGVKEVFFVKEGKHELRKDDSHKEDFQFTWDCEIKREKDVIEENEDGIKKGEDNKKIITGNANYASPIWTFDFFIPQRKGKFKKIDKFCQEEDITLDNIMDKKKMNTIIREYGLNSNALNLVCAHGPTEKMFMQAICSNKFIPSYKFDYCWKYDFLCDCSYCSLREKGTGFQFLTGDAEITDKRNQKAFLTKYQSDLRKSILFQVPHHGSKANWKDWFSEYQPFCNLWPVTHNANHEYRKGTFPSATFSYIAPYSVTEVKSTGLGIQIHFTSEKNQIVKK